MNKLVVCIAALMLMSSNEELLNEYVLLDTVPLSVEEQIHIQEVCYLTDVDYRFAFALIESESHFEWQVGDTNLANQAIGYFQISQINEERMNDEYGLDIYDSMDNLEAGVRIMSELQEAYKDGYCGYDTETCVVMCYKCGETKGRKLMRKGKVLKVVQTIKDSLEDYEVITDDGIY